MKKPEAMPLSSLFVERRREPVTPFDPAKGGVVVDLLDTTMKRLRFELSMPTATPGLLQVVEDEHDRCAAEFAARQLKHAANSEKGGAASVQSRRSDRAYRNEAIANEARRLMAPPSNRSPHEICGILAAQDISQGLSTKQIRTILQDEGVLEKRRK